MYDNGLLTSVPDHVMLSSIWVTHSVTTIKCWRLINCITHIYAGHKHKKKDEENYE